MVSRNLKIFSGYTNKKIIIDFVHYFFIARSAKVLPLGVRQRLIYFLFIFVSKIRVKTFSFSIVDKLKATCQKSKFSILFCSNGILK